MSVNGVCSRENIEVYILFWHLALFDLLFHPNISLGGKQLYAICGGGTYDTREIWKTHGILYTVVVEGTLYGLDFYDLDIIYLIVYRLCYTHFGILYILDLIFGT